MTSPARLLIIADVGGEKTRHIGDEAMLESNLAALRRLIPGVVFTVISRDPAWTARHYGVDALALLGFPRGPSAAADRRAMLDRLLADATRGARDNPTIDAVAKVDGVVVSGGGNLSSTWPELLYERAALLHFARIFGKPAIVLGQTIGPRLAGDERLLLAEALSPARFVGLRELPSAALALELGIPPERLWYQCDDSLVPAPKPASVPESGGGVTASIAVTIDPRMRAAGEALFGSLVTQLRQLSEATGASLVLVPHVFGSEAAGKPSDLTEARVIAERLGIASTVIAAGLDTAGARQIAAAAALVISSRYHPIVFGLAAGTPCLGIYGDEYCRIKLQGALAHAHLERWTLSCDDVSRGELLTSALELWQGRDDVRHTIQSRHDAWIEESRERWAAIVRALDPAQILPQTGPATLFGRPAQGVARGLASALQAQHRAWQPERPPFERLNDSLLTLNELQRLESYARGLEEELAPARTLRRYARALLRRLKRIAGWEID